eukprot:8295063-Pyramimonas_sp.AAC.1
MPELRSHPAEVEHGQCLMCPVPASETFLCGAQMMNAPLLVSFWRPVFRQVSVAYPTVKLVVRGDAADKQARELVV